MAAAGVLRDGSLAEAHDEVVALRPDERDAVPQLLLAHVRQAAPIGELERAGIRHAGLASLPRILQRVGVGQGNGIGPLVGGCDGIVERGNPGIELGDEREPRRGHAGADGHQLLVPERHPVDTGLLAPDGAQQGVALREDARQLDQVAHHAAVALGKDRIEEATPLPGRAHEQQHLLGPEEDRAHHLPDRRRATGEAVHAHPLPQPDRRLDPRQERFHPRPIGAAGIDQVEPNAGVRGPVLDELRLDRRSWRATGDRHHDRLEQVRLARPVGAGDDRQARLEVQLGAGIAAEVLEGQSGQAHRSAPHRCGRRGVRRRCGPA